MLSPTSKLTKLATRQAEPRLARQANDDFSDNGYEDSLWSCSECDSQPPPAATAEVAKDASGLPIRKSKLTKAEQKQAALWKQQVDAAIDAQDSLGPAAWGPGCSGEDWE